MAHARQSRPDSSPPLSRGEAQTVVAAEGGVCSLPEVGGACAVLLGSDSRGKARNLAIDALALAGARRTRRLGLAPRRPHVELFGARKACCYIAV